MNLAFYNEWYYSYRLILSRVSREDDSNFFLLFLLSHFFYTFKYFLKYKKVINTFKIIYLIVRFKIKRKRKILLLKNSPEQVTFSFYNWYFNIAPKYKNSKWKPFFKKNKEIENIKKNRDSNCESKLWHRACFINNCLIIPLINILASNNKRMWSYYNIRFSSVKHLKQDYRKQRIQPCI